MEFTDVSVAAQTRYSARGSFSVPAGKKLKLETFPQGEDVLESDEVPAGKKWTVTGNFTIVETDA